MNQRLLLMTAFITGAVIMILEIAGFRAFAPYYGYSVYVWGSLIGIVLVALSTGYYFGGKLVDLKPKQELLYKLLLLSSIYILIILFTYKSIMEFFTKTGIIYGALLSALVIFAPPMAIISITTPFITKLTLKKDKYGFTAGKVYSVATIGSIFGVFFSTFFLIPFYGLQVTLNTSFILILAVSILGLSFKSKKTLFLFLLIAFLFIVPSQTQGKAIYHQDSLYNQITIEKEEDTIILKLNNIVQTIYKKDSLFFGWYFDLYSIGPVITPVKEILHLGIGGGTVITQIQKTYPEINIDAVEIDSAIVDAAKEFFGLKQDNLNIYIDDARSFVKFNDKTYDIIQIDLFGGGIFVPYYLVTEEFYELIDKRLNPKGIIMINVLDAHPDRKILSRIETTLLEIFPSVFNIPVLHNNFVIASKKQITIEEIKKRLSENSIKSTPFQSVIEYSIDNIIESKKGKLKFTDDKAPIEQLTYDMIPFLDLPG